jgi:hypothetical protein
MTSAIVYQFVTTVPTSATSAHVSLARKEVVDRCFSHSEMGELFGGLARYEDTKTGEEWIGVWSARKASKFRRLLRERGTILVLVKSAPSNFRLKAAYSGRPLDSKRRS